MGVILFRQSDNRPLEIGVVEARAKHIQEIESSFADAPGRAHAKIIEFTGLVRSVPALSVGGQVGKRYLAGTAHSAGEREKPITMSD
jgi:hypothetical protein